MPEFVNFRSTPVASDQAAVVFVHGFTTHCANALDPGSRKWTLPSEGDALLFLGRSAEDPEKHQRASQNQLEAWEAQSMEAQAVRVTELCGLSENEIKRLANFHEGELA